MVRIKAMYRIPSKKEFWLISSYQNTVQDSPKLSQDRTQEKERIEHIPRNILNMLPNKNLKWTIRIIPENDFLLSILSLECKTQAITNQSSDNSESMELLAINLLENPLPSNDLSYNTPKILSKVQDEDIIEVFL